MYTKNSKEYCAYILDKKNPKANFKSSSLGLYGGADGS